MNFSQIQNIFNEQEIPNYRLKQIKKAYFVDLVKNWDEITTLPKDLREKLSNSGELISVKQKDLYKSKDKRSYKALLELNDKNDIETVLMLYKDYASVCVSSQVGCQMMCRFCATSKMGCVRDLTSEEIVDQVVFWKQYIKENLQKYKDKHINVVFMGMGEPFRNTKGVYKALEIMLDKECLNIGSRHISVSTCGIVPKINEFTKKFPQVNLSISLNAADDNKRKELMPAASAFSIRALLKALDFYIQKTNRKVFIEYVMLKKINDTEHDAHNLAKILKDKKLVHVNLINYNASDKTLFPTTEVRIEKFTKILEKNKIAYTVRDSLAQDIKGACGQLVSSKL